MIYKLGLSVAASIIFFRIEPDQGVINAILAIIIVFCGLIVPAIFLEIIIKDEVIFSYAIVILAIGAAFYIGSNKGGGNSASTESCREYGRYAIKVCR